MMPSFPVFVDDGEGEVFIGTVWICAREERVSEVSRARTRSASETRRERTEEEGAGIGRGRRRARDGKAEG